MEKKKPDLILISKSKNKEQNAEEKNEKEYITFYGTMDVAKMLGCSPPVARAVMYRADFPLIRVGKALKVSKPAFEEWTLQNRT